MKTPKNSDEAVSLEILADGHCKSINNAKRLINDGEILIECKRFLGAIGLFRLATEELAKAHLINQAVMFDENDKDKWEWFWKVFYKHKEKLQLLEYELHWKSYQDRNEFNKRIKLLLSTREDSIYVKFDRRNKKFITPREVFNSSKNIKDMAYMELNYALKLFQIFTTGGIPTQETLLKVYKFQRKQKHID